MYFLQIYILFSFSDHRNKNDQYYKTSMIKSSDFNFFLSHCYENIKYSERKYQECFYFLTLLY